MLLEWGGGTSRLPQFESLGRLRARLSHFLLFKLFFSVTPASESSAFNI